VPAQARAVEAGPASEPVVVDPQPVVAVPQPVVVDPQPVVAAREPAEPIQPHPPAVRPEAPPPSPVRRAATAKPPVKARGRSRSRRFTLPPLDEDHARSARAIEAFLGGPAAPTAASAERPPRRRHRVRRPAGTATPRTTLIVSLAGFVELERAMGEARAGTVATAFLDALRRSARSTDELRDLGGGRTRLVVETDDAGATAYLDRARATTQPWLELLSVPLRLEVGPRESTDIIAFDGARRMAGG
jgi:hypothetical protein